MKRFTLIGAASLGLLVLIGTCFWPAIAGRQFAYRDAAHFYYPLYQKVQSEWDAGRIPLWETEENSGMPLLGNPTAAVLYPGKLIYAVLPYPMAARVYVIAHVLLAFAGMLALGRSLGIGVAGSAISAFAYAFGAPVLFQYCNIIYLVGAAWVPWGLRAIDGWLRQGRRWAVPGLAIVLAMQVLGGEPQAAYLEGLCGGVYAILLSRRDIERTPWNWRRKVAIAVLGIGTFVSWIGLTFLAAHYLPPMRPRRLTPPTSTFAWTPYVTIAVSSLWGLAAVLFVRRWAKRDACAVMLGRRFAGLAIAAGLAGALAGAQLIPVAEFASLTGRNADEGAHDVYPFSLEPYRVIEMIWPNVFGSMDQGNRAWINAIPPATSHRVWIPSLYLGGATLVLALGAFGVRGAPPWRGWIAGIAVISLVASFGEFAGPLWLGRFFAPIAEYAGAHDPYETNAIRVDGALRDGDGSLYWMLATAIPGFQQFRYPSKLLTFTCAAVALLAGYGWDRVLAGDRKRILRWAGGLLGLSIVGAIAVQAKRAGFVGWLSSIEVNSPFGPLEPDGAWLDLRNALLQGTAVLALAIAATLAARRRPAMAGAFFLLVVAGDLALANRRLIMTVDQAAFETLPRVIEIIQEAEKANPSPGPYRVHRMPIWNPIEWTRNASPRRAEEFVEWERDTIQPKYGLPYEIQYTHTLGVAELFDYEWFFAPFTVAVEPAIAKQLRLARPDERVVYYPRRGFDLWNTRYFILPAFTPWTSTERGVLALLNETEKIFPKVGAFGGTDGQKRSEEWMRTQDFQVVRNLTAFPRAWIVHDVRLLPPVSGLTRDARKGPMEEMLYAGDGLWRDESRHVFDLKSLAYVEVADDATVRRFRTRGEVSADESVTVREVNPQRIELEVVMNRPGFVILAEVFYPGWTLTIDGQAATILRANRMMRGATVDSGRHKLVYEYHPRSFALGKIASGVGLLAFIISSGWAAWGSRQRRRQECEPIA
jgi:hypothetical protein